MKEVKRPWGKFTQLALNKKCTVKILEVKPNSELSLQKHKKRSEEWYFLTPGFVQLGLSKKTVKKVKKGARIKIGKGKVHRAIAKKKPVLFLEVSYGKFNEKDEIRLEDKYGRK